MSRAPLEPTKRKELYRRFRNLSEGNAARVLGYMDALEEERDIGPLLNSDRDHDVLRIRFPLPSDAFSYDDEEFPGIYVSRSEKDNRITGFTVFDYSRRSLRELKLLLPMVEWDEVSGRIQ